MANILILGAGAMGSAFTLPCLDNGNEVVLVGTLLEDKVIDELNGEFLEASPPHHSLTTLSKRVNC